MAGDIENHMQRTGRQAILIKGKDDMGLVLREKKVELVQEFAFLFYQNMVKVLQDSKLSHHDMLVLFSMLARMSTKSELGLVAINQAGMAKELGTTQTQVSRSCSRLEAAGLLLRDEDGDLSINPAVILKGSPKDLYAKRNDLLAQGMKAIGVDSVI